MTNGTASLLFAHHRFRRVVGLVLLALFVRQTTALGWTACDDAGAARTSPATGSMAGMAGMAGMAHEQHDAGGDDTRPAQPPDHRSGCDHTTPAADCSIGIGCVVVVPGTAVVVTEANSVPTEVFHFPALTRPRSLEFAPDTPPPRS